MGRLYDREASTPYTYIHTYIYKGIRHVPNTIDAAVCNKKNREGFTARPMDSGVGKWALLPSRVVGLNYTLGPEPSPLYHIIPVNERKDVLLEVVVLPGTTVSGTRRRMSKDTHLRGLAWSPRYLAKVSLGSSPYLNSASINSPCPVSN